MVKRFGVAAGPGCELWFGLSFVPEKHGAAQDMQSITSFYIIYSVTIVSMSGGRRWSSSAGFLEHRCNLTPVTPLRAGYFFSIRTSWFHACEVALPLCIGSLSACDTHNGFPSQVFFSRFQIFSFYTRGKETTNMHQVWSFNPSLYIDDSSFCTQQSSGSQTLFYWPVLLWSLLHSVCLCVSRYRHEHDANDPIWKAYACSSEFELWFPLMQLSFEPHRSTTLCKVASCCERLNILNIRRATSSLWYNTSELELSCKLTDCVQLLFWE